MSQSAEIFQDPTSFAHHEDPALIAAGNEFVASFNVQRSDDQFPQLEDEYAISTTKDRPNATLAVSYELLASNPNGLIGSLSGLLVPNELSGGYDTGPLTVVVGGFSRLPPYRQGRETEYQDACAVLDEQSARAFNELVAGLQTVKRDLGFLAFRQFQDPDATELRAYTTGIAACYALSNNQPDQHWLISAGTRPERALRGLRTAYQRLQTSPQDVPLGVKVSLKGGDSDRQLRHAALPIEAALAIPPQAFRFPAEGLIVSHLGDYVRAGGIREG